MVSIVLARLLLPEAYGTVALLHVFTNLLGVFVDSGMGTALIQKKNADTIDFSTLFFFNLSACLVLYALMFVCAPAIANFYHRPELTAMVRVVSLTLLISGVKNIQQSYISRNLLFKKLFIATLCANCCSAVVGIVLAYRGCGAWALVTQSLCYQAISTIVLWLTVEWRPTLAFSWQRLGGLFQYGWKLLISKLLDKGYMELRSLIIGRKYSAEDLAFYNRGHHLPGVALDAINESIDSVLFPTMSARQDEPKQVRVITRRSITTSCYLIFPLMCGLAACAEPMIRLLLGTKWLPAVPYLRIMCFAYAFYPVHTANLNAIKAMGRSDLFLYLEIVKKIIGLIAVLVTMWISVMAMAYSIIFTTVLSQVINSYPNWKLLNYRYFDQMKDILPSIVLSCAMALAVYGVQFLGLNDWLTLGLQIPLGAAVYLGGSWLFRLEAFQYLVELAGRALKARRVSAPAET